MKARPADDGAHGVEAPHDVGARLRAALLEAIRTQDVVAAFALRSALSAIGNAEAIPAGPDGGVGPGGTGGRLAPDRPNAEAGRPGGTPAPSTTSPYVAGAVTGLAATEVPPRTLTPADVSDIVRAEAAERVTAAGQCEQAGHPDRAERLRREASILLAVLNEMEWPAPYPRP